MTCKYESHSEAKFFDLQLTVKNEFENQQNESVEQALKSFLKIETLNGDNQYACPKCAPVKQDAEKGVKFVKLPKILMLQLTRFTLDFQTFNRKKLNDSVSFPLVLNMNHFLDQEELKDDQIFEKLVKDNPLNEVKSKMAKNERKVVKKEATGKDGLPLNDMQKNFAQQMNDELGGSGPVEDTGEAKTAGSLAQARAEKRKKEAEEHKKRLAEMKAKKAASKTAKPTRPKFDRGQLSAGFMANAKVAKVDHGGWAMDFGNEAQNVAIPSASGNADLDQTEKAQLDQVLKLSLSDANSTQATEGDKATVVSTPSSAKTDPSA